MYIEFEKITETKAIATYIFMDESQLTPIQKTKGRVLNIDYPTPERIEGKVAQMYFNPSNDTFFFEYIDQQPTQEEIISGLQAQNAQMLLALVEGGLM